MKGTLKNPLLVGTLATILLGITLLPANRASARGLHSQSMQSSHIQSLDVVGYSGTQVEKTVSFPGTLITQNNWNTDFAVPGDESFKEFVTTLVPQKNGQYNVSVNLKYSDGTYDEVYKEQGLHLHKGEPLTVTATPRLSQIPYQVNVDVGGLSGLGDTYTVKVVGIK